MSTSVIPGDRMHIPESAFTRRDLASFGLGAVASQVIPAEAQEAGFDDFTSLEPPPYFYGQMVMHHKLVSDPQFLGGGVKIVDCARIWNGEKLVLLESQEGAEVWNAIVKKIFQL